MANLQSAFGIFALLALAWIVSEDRRGVAWRQAAVALLVTFVTAVILLKVPGATRVFAAINDAVDAIAAASRAGTSFVFGYLGGGQLPYELKVPGAEFVLALQALPIVLVMSVLTTLLFHWRILPPLVHGFSWLLERTLKVRARLVKVDQGYRRLDDRHPMFGRLDPDLQGHGVAVVGDVEPGQGRGTIRLEAAKRVGHRGGRAQTAPARGIDKPSKYPRL